MKRKIKGLAPLISTILIVGILAVLTFSAYYWGKPIIEKNVDITTLNKAEEFLRNLDRRIDSIAKYGGTDEIIYRLSGEIEVNPQENKIEFFVDTVGTIYSPNTFVCFSRNCDLQEGNWGEDSYSVIGVYVYQNTSELTSNHYKIIYRNLTAYENGNKKTYMVDLITTGNLTLVGSKDSKIIIRRIGIKRNNDVTKTVVEIDIR